jgi:predicted transcriptional regulator
VELLKQLLYSIPLLVSSKLKKLIIRLYELVEESEKGTSVVHEYKRDTMPIYEDFKKISLLKEVMSDDFCILRSDDLLAKAVAIILLRDVNHIVIVDQNNKFLCTVSDASILREVPPRISDIPPAYRSEASSTSGEINKFTLEVVSKPLEDIFRLETSSRYFYETDDNLSRALEDLASPSIPYTSQKLIPVLNSKHQVAGVVSAKEVIEYIINKYRETSLFQETLRKAFPDKFSEKKLHLFSPTDKLVYAYLSIEYIPREFILVCNDQLHLLGTLDRRKIISMNHSTYRYLADIPLGEIMEPLEPFFLVEATQKIEEIIPLLLSKNRSLIIVEDKSADVVVPVDIVSLADVLKFFFANLH